MWAIVGVVYLLVVIAGSLMLLALFGGLGYTVYLSERGDNGTAYPSEIVDEKEETA